MKDLISQYWLACVIVAAISGHLRAEGVLLYRSHAEQAERFWRPIEYDRLKSYDAAFKAYPKGGGQPQSIPRYQVGAVIELPRLATLCLVNDSDLQALTAMRANLADATVRYEKAAAIFTPIVHQIDLAVSKYQAGNVLISGRWLTRDEYDAEIAAGNRGIKAISEVTVNGRTYKNVIVTSVKGDSINFMHDGGIASIKAAELPGNVFAMFKGQRKNLFPDPNDGATTDSVPQRQIPGSHSEVKGSPEAINPSGAGASHADTSDPSAAAPPEQLEALPTLKKASEVIEGLGDRVTISEFALNPQKWSIDFSNLINALASITKIRPEQIQANEALRNYVQYLHAIGIGPQMSGVNLTVEKADRFVSAGKDLLRLEYPGLTKELPQGPSPQTPESPQHRGPDSKPAIAVPAAPKSPIQPEPAVRNSSSGGVNTQNSLGAVDIPTPSDNVARKSHPLQTGYWILGVLALGLGAIGGLYGKHFVKRAQRADKKAEIGAALVKFYCLHCDQRISADASAAGSEFNCPCCGRSIVVPSNFMITPRDAGAGISQRFSRRRALGFMGVGFFLTSVLAVVTWNVRAARTLAGRFNGQKTLQYWAAANREPEPPQEPSIELVAHNRSADYINGMMLASSWHLKRAEELRMLPTEAVDPEMVDLVLSLADVESEAGLHRAESANWVAAQTDLEDTYSHLPAETVRPLQKQFLMDADRVKSMCDSCTKRSREVMEKRSAWLSKAPRVRAELSERYGLKF